MAQYKRCIATRHGGGCISSTGSLCYSPSFQQRRRRATTMTTFAKMDLRLRHNERSRRPENTEGPFYVDHSCIDCDTCRWIAPATFGRVGRQSAVIAQPAEREGRLQALRALLSCPTYSIHVSDRSSDELKAAHEGLPARVPGMGLSAAETGPANTTAGTASDAEGVYYTGWASEASLACSAYLIVRPGGNIMVDVPRYNPVLARRIEALGGIQYLFLTHRDDVAGHEEWAQHFGAKRILHELEVNERQGTHKVEIKLTGEGPWALDRDGDVVPMAATATGTDPEGSESDVTFIFTPGHTKGHVCMYYAPYKSLFSGDHLCSAGGKVEGASQEELYIFSEFNWYSVPEQLRSVSKLLQYDWLYVLPAHGRRAHLRDATARLAAVNDLLVRNSPQQS